ncbi:3-hydroxyacyl-CoA dehydrogenase NAD-binding domain-containing protein [Anaerobacillus sp. 1_MG-2023]|uniref:3-hydroxyacyl-CoA dehydrogenase family protein n=1 Tax=Bacillales TaxID=1385 RepID=UPI0026E210A9|nr:3-hydroxyacyl-CoA dehydrogenase NAD-binding domain-containing protein [Anaerobacillus sp. 1_MG-2023]MDO6656805.1 3-hydroxyacyl-CoA dehydrogenase NAD-binding domain-containing protein [Anaerobacillus sp. 1_MG-2023]
MCLLGGREMTMTKMAVVGAGTMGKGIAFSAAAAGLSVKMHDVSNEALKQAQIYVKDQFERLVKKEKITREQATKRFEGIQFTNELKEAVYDCDLVIEAVLEVMELKTSIFKQLDEFAPAHAILATNTSTMSPTEIAAQTMRPDQCLALHFFNPVPKMKLIEVICGLETSEDTIDKAMRFGESIGKECVRINEFPGFAVSRMNCLIGNEAMNMVMEGVATPEDIDKAMKLGLNHPMGPLELADLVGLDTRLRNMEYLYKTLGEKYRPCPILTKYVKAGRLGRKSGRGFYTY